MIKNNIDMMGDYNKRLEAIADKMNSFQVEMIDYCATPILIATGQTDPPTYNYDGIATFTLNAFSIAPSECEITYSCKMVQGPSEYDLCGFSGQSTSSSFSAQSGEYSFESTDW